MSTRRRPRRASADRRHIAVGLILAAVAVTQQAVSDEPEVPLEGPAIELAWAADDGAARAWRVRTRTDGSGGRWVSLLSEDLEARPLSRHLALTGAGIGRDAWSATADGDAVILETDALDGRVRVRQHLQLGEEPYRLRLRIAVENRTDALLPAGALADLRLMLGPGLGETPAPGLGIAGRMYSYVEAIARQDGRTGRFALHAPDDAGALPVGGSGLAWIGLHSRYFALLVAPAGDTVIDSADLLYPKGAAEGPLPARFLPALSLAMTPESLVPGARVEREFRIFSGPKSRAALAAGEGEFSGVLFAGLWQWMRGLCFGLLRLLEWIHALVGNWGVAIIMLALLVRAALFPLARRTLASQQAFAEVQRRIQPEMREIRRRYRGGEQSEKILELYARHDVSPLAGLKPLLIVALQIPVFVALFHVLGQAFELRQAPFLWIDTLAEPDQLFGFGTELPFFGAYFNLLPVLMALTTLATMKLSPAPAADAAARRRQNLFLGLMALGFFLLFWPFPAGMVLYWTVANLLHIAQSRIHSIPQRA